MRGPYAPSAGLLLYAIGQATVSEVLGRIPDPPSRESGGEIYVGRRESVPAD
jgi:hypothetical protein